MNTPTVSDDGWVFVKGEFLWKVALKAKQERK